MGLKVHPAYGVIKAWTGAKSRSSLHSYRSVVTPKSQLSKSTPGFPFPVTGKTAFVHTTLKVILICFFLYHKRQNL